MKVSRTFVNELYKFGYFVVVYGTNLGNVYFECIIRVATGGDGKIPIILSR
jgi:hypothetical protein